MRAAVLALALVFVFASGGRAQGTMAYGSPISIETAKKVAAPAIAEARKNNWQMAVAIAKKWTGVEEGPRADTPARGSQGS